MLDFLRRLASRIWFWVNSVLDSDALDLFIILMFVILPLAAVLLSSWCLIYGPWKWIIR